MDNIYKKLEETLAKNKYTSYVHPPYELERKLVIAIQEMDYEKSLSILKEINSLERAQLSKRPLLSLKYSLIGSCTLFARAVIEVGLDAETSFMLSDYYINKIDEAATFDDVQALEYLMLGDFIKVLRKNKEFTYNSLINRVISYIRKNIEENFTLQDISSYVGVHPNYLSAAFKKEVGKTLSEYINEHKIASIKLYIKHTNLSISEISYTFNFSHVTYFSRFFKKHTGMTPMDYRKLNSNMNSLIEHTV
ncbi:AraC family transcriptional regulator [Clostridium thermarum]|uniref:AraC family transcriptional regulator n=1 Tax=Clostridium thermarum TaxID=1716543 RepID=UPI00111E7FE9|nr:AraC family transcriptional regulator [Clostridium thermarum]